jgi:hypothetical protein
LLKLTKIARIFTPLFLVIVIGYITNATINQHSHKLSSGIVVTHSHPFNNGGTGTPFQDHKHGSEELILLSQISISLFRIYLFIIILSTTAAISVIKTPFQQNSSGTSGLFFLNNYHAPPPSTPGF